ncbi:hypothetical protein JCM10212_005656 [Sporobolomyces blumeae]
MTDSTAPLDATVSSLEPTSSLPVVTSEPTSVAQASTTASSVESSLTPTSAEASQTTSAAETATSSPPPSEPPTLAISSPLPSSSASILTDVPLTSIPPVPEFLSFNEWREKYVVVPDPAVAHARRAKKAAQRHRQDIVGAVTAGAAGAVYDGDGADLGSLLGGSDEAVLEGEGSSRIVGDSAKPTGTPFVDRARRRSDITPPANASTQSMSPIQPLPNVGTGDETDPLVALRDRSNYAAFECAAMVHRSSRQSKGASSILVEKKDRYMLTPCSADPKFVEVELCDEIQIDTIVLANFEFFASMFKHFKASCSVNYPGSADEWHDLGTFRARNVRGIQVFRPHFIPNFCRYIRINFLSHFGSEYYCPVSLLRVYGYTQLDAYRESERKARIMQEALAAAEEYADEADEGEDVGLDEATENDETEQDVGMSVDHRLDEGGESHRPAPAPNSASESSFGASPTTRADWNMSDSWNATAATQADDTAPIASTTLVSPGTTEAPTVASVEPTFDDGEESAAPEPTASPTVALTTSGAALNGTDGRSATTAASSGTLGPSPLDLSAPTRADSITAPAADATNSIHRVGSNATRVSENELSPTHAVPRPVAPSDLPIIHTRPRNDSHHVSPAHQSHHPPSTHRPPVLPPPIQQPQPGESIYGTIMKRLTSLEHNQTLSMHFIEAQSSMLREAFGRIERRLTEVEAMRSRQEQGIRQALLDLEKERNGLERERLTLSAQVSMLAQEARVERRLSIVQIVAVVVLVIFVGFTRSIPTSPFLHLASSAAAGGQRMAAKRIDAHPMAQAQFPREPSETEAPQQPLVRRLSGNVGPKHSTGHAKRYPSISKPGPRRHYGTGTTTSGRGSALVKSPRSWVPPVRHSSAPPEEVEEVFAASVSSALEAKELRRRTGALGKRPASPFEFPRRSKLEREISAEPESRRSISSAGPPFSAENPRASPSSIGDKPLTPFEPAFERSAMPNPRLPTLPVSLGGASDVDHDHYTTTDDDEDAPPSPRPLPSPVPVSPARAGIRPPKPNVPSRPATSMGIPFPSRTSCASFDRGLSQTSHRPAPSPPSALPSPPPEPPSPVIDSAGPVL